MTNFLVGLPDGYLSEDWTESAFLARVSPPAVDRIDRMKRAALLMFSVAVLGVDQLTKAWAVATLWNARAPWILPGPIDLTLVFNRSNAFGLAPVIGQVSRWILTSVNVSVAAVLVWLLLRRPFSRPTEIGLALIVAGALGNAFDRIRFGAVIDFLDAAKIGFVWVFNLADVSLDIGIALVLLNSALHWRESE